MAIHNNYSLSSAYKEDKLTEAGKNERLTNVYLVASQSALCALLTLPFIAMAILAKYHLLNSHGGIFYALLPGPAGGTMAASSLVITCGVIQLFKTNFSAEEKRRFFILNPPPAPGSDL